MKYVGLTDHPRIRKKEHRSPQDWHQEKFDSERQARNWEKRMLKERGFTGGTGGEGWMYGYTYTMTKGTKP